MILNKATKQKYTEIEEAIESTISFKYIRSMEAIFESSPQAILQLVYIMRTSQFEINQSSIKTIIVYMSIIQSILSMTNSIIKDDKFTWYARY